MAEKRKIKVIEEEVESEERREPALKHTESWPLWLRNEFLRYWYIVGCLFIDAIVFLQLYLVPDRPILISAVVVILLLIAEIFIYGRIWGKKRVRGDSE